MAGLPLEWVSFLFLAATLAGFIDTLAGGGGLIALPALLMSGIPPLFALGTNKLQGTAGTATATWMMLRKRLVTWREAKVPMLTAFIGAGLGTVAVQFINTELLTLVIPVVLAAIAVYFLLSPQPPAGTGRVRISPARYRNLVIPSIGCYDGMFGPGTGSFFAMIGVSLRGQGLIEATATAKTLNFATNMASLIVFLLAGKVIWLAGTLMMAGQLLGAWAGSHCLLKIPPRYLRLLVVIMCSAMLVRYVLAAGWL